MFVIYIHVVQDGDTVFDISVLYGVPISNIVENNIITNGDSLVIGQTVVIPVEGIYHIVEVGDSLYRLSNEYNIAIEKLYEDNGMNKETVLNIGEAIYIDRSDKVKATIGVYIDTSITGSSSGDVVSRVSNELSRIIVFSYQVLIDGTLSKNIDNPILKIADDN